MHGKNNIFKFTVFTLVLAVLTMGVLVHYRGKHLAEQQAVLIEENFIASKRAALKNYVELALSSIEPLYGSGRDDAATQDQAKAILQTVNYGDDGYFFVYDLAGNNLVHPRKPEFVGRNLWEMTDPKGRHFIQDFVEAATHGDGFQVYVWEKPSTRKMTEQLGYVVMLERWGWIVGTGIYLDDVETATRAVKKRAAANLQELVGIALGVALAVFITGLALNVREHRSAERALKTMAQRIVTRQEEERARVAKELHDGISQQLTCVKWRFELAHHNLESGSSGAIDEIDKGVKELIVAIGDIRRISQGLRPLVLDALGFSAAIVQLAAEFERRTSIAVNVENHVGELTLPENKAVALFRITQEAFTNVERHSSATMVTVKLTAEPRWVHLDIVDNGRGFCIDSLNPAGGSGLRNIRERIEHLEGRFNLHSEPGQTRLAVALPMHYTKV